MKDAALSCFLGSTQEGVSILVFRAHLSCLPGAFIRCKSFIVCTFFSIFATINYMN